VQYGGLDKYVLNTKADLLGWEGMRLRVAVREAQERNALEASSSPSEAPTHGASANATRPIPLVSHSHFRFSSPIDIVFHILLLQAVIPFPLSRGCVSGLTSWACRAKMYHVGVCELYRRWSEHGNMRPASARSRSSLHRSFVSPPSHRRRAAGVPKTPVRLYGSRGWAPTRASH
jgi:hypothetical protein